MPRRSDDLHVLERTLGYDFDDRSLLREALTHSSAPGAPSNERLEFLGDRVLGLVIAQALIARYPDESEGDLAPRFNALVRKETCAAVAETLGIGPHLNMARSEAQSGGRRKQALLGDAMEAVIAAVFLDGGLIAARDVVLDGWRAHLDAQDQAPVDAKTALQEWVQARALPLPDYRIVSRDGPDHNPKFRVEVRLSTGETAEGTAASKRAAQQQAASALLAALEHKS